MPLFEEILEQPINLIKDYIEQNKIYTSEQNTASFAARLQNTLCWTFGKNIDFTAQKVQLAQDFLDLLTSCIAANRTHPDIYRIKSTLEAAQEKINIEIRTILTKRILQKMEPGSYDARLKVFLQLVSYMLEPEKLKFLEKTVVEETNKPESHITKLLLFLEKTLFSVKFNFFLQEQNVLLSSPNNFSKEHCEFIEKTLTDLIPVLYATQIDKAGIDTNRVLSYQRIGLISHINGLEYELQDKQSSIGVRNIIAALNNLRQSIKEEQNSYELTQQDEALHKETLPQCSSSTPTLNRV